MSLVPVTILTGFLGSGKTTLLRHLLGRPELARTAVIVNEFGEIGLDHLLVADAKEDIVELNSGCLCCTVRGDLIETLGRLEARRRADGKEAFDRIVVETTGLADPAPIIHTLTTHERLAANYRLDGVVTVVDAANGAGTLDRHQESVKQAAMADRLVLSKTDLEEGQAGRQGLEERLRGLNPAADIIAGGPDSVSPRQLFDAGLYDPSTKAPDVARWLREEAYETGPQDGSHHDHHHAGHDHGHDHDHHHGHDHGHGHDHSHDPNRHDDRIQAYCIVREEAISSAAFSLFVEILTMNRGPDLLRVKGIVKLAEEPDRPAVVHGVQHVFHPPVRLDAWPDEDRRTKLVFITRDIPRAWIDRLLDALSENKSALAS